MCLASYSFKQVVCQPLEEAQLLDRLVEEQEELDLDFRGVEPPGFPAPPLESAAGGTSASGPARGGAGGAGSVTIKEVSEVLNYPTKTLELKPEECSPTMVLFPLPNCPDVFIP